MAEDIQIEIVGPAQVIGSTVFAIAVKITNISSDELHAVSVDALLLPGDLLDKGKEEEENPLTEQELIKRRLVREMEAQIQRAYHVNRLETMPPLLRLARGVAQILETYARLFSLGRGYSSELIPPWAQESLRIQ